MTRSRVALLLGVAVILLVFAWPAVAAAHVIERVSVSSAEVQGDDGSYSTSLSADGRYVAFYSYAANLVAGDTNNGPDIFVRDRQTGVTTRESLNSAEEETGFFSASYDPAISADGRYVAFQSDADNLVAGDTNGVYDIFVRDRTAGTTTRVSASTGGAQADAGSAHPAISADGRYVVFDSDATNLVAGDSNGFVDVFVHDRNTGTTERVSVAAVFGVVGGDSGYPSISADGRYVVFQSEAANLVSGDANNLSDVFLRDCVSDWTVCMSMSNKGVQGNGDSSGASISPDGRYVGFTSQATNLVTGDTNGFMDVFLRDWDPPAGDPVTERISIATDGSQGDDYSADAAISSGGRYVAFSSHATSLVNAPSNGWQQVYVRDRQAARTTRVSVNSANAPGEGACGIASITSDGGLVAFTTEAPNLVTGDTNAQSDVFVALGHVVYTSIRGTHRYHTAQLISQAMFPAALPAGSGCVIAPGETYQEALCGAPLAAAYGGPVLLTPTVGLENGTKTVIQRLIPTYVICVGLSDAVVTSVKAAVPNALVTAIVGANVYEMSYKVAKKLEERVESLGGEMADATAIVTVGTQFADALALSPLACHKQWPILLTDYSDARPMNAYALQAITETGITTYLKAGTYVPDPSGVVGVGNLSGATRYETCARVADWGKASGGLTFVHTGMATGDNFPDALASGPYLAKDSGTLLLSPLYGPVPAPITAVLSANADWVQHVTFIACIEPVIGQVKALLP